MSKSWYNTESDSEAQDHMADFWIQHRKELREGDFWAERIKEFKGEPVKQLRVALENLPLPASFREAAIATRAMIREKRRLKENYDDELVLLYWLAAINSFSIPYSEVLKEPGYNIVESIPGKKLKDLAFSYHVLGYQNLELLNKTDIKWIVSHWGQPGSHTTLHDLHLDIWKEYENKLKAKRDKSDQAFLRELNNLSLHVGTVNTKSKAPGRRRSSRWYIGVAILLFIIILVIANRC